MKQLPLYNPNFLELQASFTDWLLVLGYSDSTLKYAPLHLREFLYFLENQQVDKIRQVKRDQVKAFFSYLSERANQRDGGRLSMAYVAKHWQAVRLLDRYLRETGEWGLPLPKGSVQPHRKIQPVLTQDEVQLLFNAGADDMLGIRDRAALALFYGCGLRRSEGLGLDVGDVLLEKGLVYVRKGKNYKERYVPMSAGVIRHVRRYLEDARPEILDTCPYRGRRDKRALLLSARGTRVNDRTITLRFRSLQADAGNLGLSQKRVNLHSFRHAIATHLLERGMGLTRIARFLGHTKLESTQIYTHLLDGAV
ncbi:tyrosine-type recombinase/integrase [Pontibacter chitinilyticus]|uniref:tyrosine-type recombinase/integrase n=1 Tax=Pontibacter chitinilyticus TaxID=2674989 RepID=UPI00321A444E